jgi:cell division protein FtsI (penicillin-binding protein 3)
MLIAATGINGTGKKAVPAGYHVAGKTGTAQKANHFGSYAKDKFTAIFAGFVPAEAPEIVIVVIVDEPQKSIYGGSVSAPIFRNIAATTLPYLGILPASQEASEWQSQVIQIQSNYTPMPEHFIGLSLRESYKLASQYGYTLRTHGSGWVVRQSPISIASLPKGAQIEVWLHE